MILDLSVFEEETLDIKTADGSVIRIPKPSERMILRILRVQVIDETTNIDVQERIVNDLVFWIFETNLDGIAFARESVENMPQAAKLAILNAYTEFARKFQENPT